MYDGEVTLDAKIRALQRWRSTPEWTQLTGVYDQLRPLLAEDDDRRLWPQIKPLIDEADRIAATMPRLSDLLADELA